ncbi:MAG: transposase [Magnetococcales bacterium]|nr:transposase [Magnetococcales bacterium]
MVSFLLSEKNVLEAEKERFRLHAEFLQGQVSILLAKRFGRSSEKVIPGQMVLGLFDEAEHLDSTAAEPEGESDETPADANSDKPRRKRDRKPLPAWLSRIGMIHELPESERVCGVRRHPGVRPGPDG